MAEANGGPFYVFVDRKRVEEHGRAVRDPRPAGVAAPRPPAVWVVATDRDDEATWRRCHEVELRGVFRAACDWRAVGPRVRVWLEAEPGAVAVPVGPEEP